LENTSVGNSISRTDAPLTIMRPESPVSLKQSQNLDG
jgi:hypothetical protein